LITLGTKEREREGISAHLDGILIDSKKWVISEGLVNTTKRENPRAPHRIRKKTEIAISNPENIHVLPDKNIKRGSIPRSKLNRFSILAINRNSVIISVVRIDRGSGFNTRSRIN
jgi:hypothetical protein